MIVLAMMLDKSGGENIANFTKFEILLIAEITKKMIRNEKQKFMTSHRRCHDKSNI